jgi:hypothetical protein
LQGLMSCFKIESNAPPYVVRVSRKVTEMSLVSVFKGVEDQSYDSRATGQCVRPQLLH